DPGAVAPVAARCRRGVCVHKSYSRFGCGFRGGPVGTFEGLCRLVLCQTRNPPTNAFKLSPALQPGGNFFSFLTFPPPRTPSSGSLAAIKRAITSLTASSHFFCPRRFRPATPT